MTKQQPKNLQQLFDTHRNASVVAECIGVSPSTVRKWARNMNITTDRTRLPRYTRDELISAYNAHQTMEATAKALGIGTSGLRAKMRKLDIQKPQKRPDKHTLETLAATHTKKQIAHTYGVTPPTVHIWLKDYGLKAQRQPYPLRLTERNAEIARAHAEGQSLAQIAAKYGTCRQRIHQIVSDPRNKRAT